MRISILLRLEMKRRCIAAFSNKCKLLRSPLVRLAVRSTPSSVLEKAFIVVRFSRNLASLHNDRNQLSLIPAPNYAPWHADFNRRGRAQHDHRGKIKNRSGGVYSEPSDLSFSLPRGAAVPPSSFINLTFTSHTGSLLLSSPKKVTFPSVFPHRP